MFSILNFQRPQIGGRIIFCPLLTLTKFDPTTTGKSLSVYFQSCVHRITKIQKYRNTEIQKYRNTEIQKIQRALSDMEGRNIATHPHH